jgi:hypothetical protein
MKKSPETLSTFVASVVALLKGNDAEAIGLKIQRKAIAALTAQVAAKVCKTLTLEDDLENAEDNLKQVRVNNGALISNNDLYITGLLDAKYLLDSAKETLEAHKADIEFLENELFIAKN